MRELKIEGYDTCFSNLCTRINVNGGIEIDDNDVILCPSKPSNCNLGYPYTNRGQWHWMLLAVNLSKQEYSCYSLTHTALHACRAYIFDSLYGLDLKPWNRDVIVGLGTYLSAILEKDIKLN